MELQKPKRKYHKKNPRQKLVEKLDNLFSLYIRKRDPACVVCGSKDNATCGHLFSRISYSLRWDESGSFRQCASCNNLHEYDPYPFTRWYQRKFGIEAYDELHRKWYAVKKLSNKDLEDKYEEIKQMLEGLE